MAEEIVFVAFEILGDLIAEGEAESLAAEVLLDETGVELVAGASDLLMGGAEPWEEAGMTNVEGVVPKDMIAILDGPASNALSAAQSHTLLSQARYFAGWVGKEILKGALFQVAMETLMSARAAKAKPFEPESPTTQLLEKIVRVLKATISVTKDWRQWAIAHYPKRKQYGTLTVQDVILYRFEIFRSNLADLDVELQKLAPLLKDASKAGENANMGLLRAAAVKYVSLCQDISVMLGDKGRLMVQARLNPHGEELQKAHDVL